MKGQHLVLLYLAPAALCHSAYPSFLPSNDAPPQLGAVNPPHKTGLEDTWHDLQSEATSEGSQLSSAASTVASGVKGLASSASSAVRPTQSPSQPHPTHIKPQYDPAHYRTIRETIDYIQPTHTHPSHDSQPSSTPSPAPGPEPAHISQFTPHLISLFKFLTFFIRHPFRFLRSYLIPYTIKGLSFLLLSILWPILRWPLATVWSIATAVVMPVTFPARWLFGLAQRWAELAVFFLTALAMGAVMGLGGAVFSGPSARRLVSGLVGGGSAKEGAGYPEAKWERVPRRGRINVPQGPARSDSGDTVRPSASQASPSTSGSMSRPSKAGSSGVGRSWASSASEVSSSLPPSSEGLHAASSIGGSGQTAGTGRGRGGPARSAAAVALAEAKRRVEEMRRAKAAA